MDTNALDAIKAVTFGGATVLIVAVILFLGWVVLFFKRPTTAMTIAAFLLVAIGYSVFSRLNNPMTWGAVIIMLVVNVVYFVGWLEDRKKKDGRHGVRKVDLAKSVTEAMTPHDVKPTETEAQHETTARGQAQPDFKSVSEHAPPQVRKPFAGDLPGRQYRYRALFSACLAVLGLAAMVIFYLNSGNRLEVVRASDLGRRQSKLAEAFAPEMLTADIAYFEQKIGPAWRTDSNSKEFKIDGCIVTANTAGGSIRSLSLDLTNDCTFDLNKFLPNLHGRIPSANALNFGRFDALTGANGRFMADCLNLCGNAADPVVYEHWQGSNADQAIEVMLGVALTGIPAIDASQTWEDAMEKSKGETWVIDTKFNCGPTAYDKVAHKAFRNVRISTISVGYDLIAPYLTNGCSPQPGG